MNAMGSVKQLARWQGIVATNKFADSTNSKASMRRFGKDVLPSTSDTRWDDKIDYGEGSLGSGIFSISAGVDFSMFSKKTENIGSISSRPS